MTVTGSHLRRCDSRRAARPVPMAIAVASVLVLVSLTLTPSTRAEAVLGARAVFSPIAQAEFDVEGIEPTADPTSPAGPSSTSNDASGLSGDSPTSLSVLESRIRQLAEQVEALSQELDALQERYFSDDARFSTD